MAKKKNKREKELQKFVACLVVIIIITVIVLAVFYISNGYKFDFGFLKKESESVSVNYSEVDNVEILRYISSISGRAIAFSSNSRTVRICLSIPEKRETPARQKSINIFATKRVTK